jgi:Tfp pilus assembly protein PilF
LLARAGAWRAGAAHAPAVSSAPQPGARARSPVESALKWVAAVTAVLSLVAGAFTVTRMLSDVRERKRFVEESLQVGARQLAAGDYVSAWSTLEAGLKSADEGGQLAKLTAQLSEERQRLRTAQEELAMQWVRHARVPSGRRFADIVDRVLPVLDRSVGATEGAARADRLASIGWGYYLKTRDGTSGLDPVRQYQAALQADPDNPYAHAFWGHWILSQRGDLREATDHFAAATRSVRAREYVRMIEVSALRNRGDAAAGELLRTTDRMRRNGEPIHPELIHEVYSIYWRMVTAGEPNPVVIESLPPLAQIEMIGVLIGGPRFDATRLRIRDAAVAMLYEAAGRRAEALAGWKTVRAATATGEDTLRSRADAAIRRLQAPARTGSTRAATRLAFMTSQGIGHRGLSAIVRACRVLPDPSATCCANGASGGA